SECFAARHSLSHLNVVGLGELVAENGDDYLRIAQALATDLPRLAALRAGLREQMRASPLLQGERFTRGLEQAFRQIWKNWCGPALNDGQESAVLSVASPISSGIMSTEDKPRATFPQSD